MKMLIVLFALVLSQGAFATTLTCTGELLKVTADYDGRAKEFSSVEVTYDGDRSKYPSAPWDETFKSTNPKNKMLAYRIMKSATMRSGMSLRLPKKKTKTDFHGILVGRDHEYHGEDTYEHLTCTLK